MSQISNDPINAMQVTESDTINSETMNVLRKIVDERYKMSFDRSRLTSASEIHHKAKQLLGVDTNYA